MCLCADANADAEVEGVAYCYIATVGLVDTFKPMALRTSDEMHEQAEVDDSIWSSLVAQAEKSEIFTSPLAPRADKSSRSELAQTQAMPKPLSATARSSS